MVTHDSRLPAPTGVPRLTHCSTERRAYSRHGLSALKIKVKVAGLSSTTRERLRAFRARQRRALPLQRESRTESPGPGNRAVTKLHQEELMAHARQEDVPADFITVGFDAVGYCLEAWLGPRGQGLTRPVSPEVRQAIAEEA